MRSRTRADWQSGREHQTSEHSVWVILHGETARFPKTAYGEVEDRLGRVKAPRGEKTALVDQAIARASGTFTLADLERSCPGVSRDMIRRVLRERARQGVVECVGRGPGAEWRRKEGNTSKRG